MSNVVILMQIFAFVYRCHSYANYSSFFVVSGATARSIQGEQVAIGLYTSPAPANTVPKNRFTSMSCTGGLQTLAKSPAARRHPGPARRRVLRRGTGTGCGACSLYDHALPSRRGRRAGNSDEPARPHAGHPAQVWRCRQKAFGWSAAGLGMELRRMQMGGKCGEKRG